MSQSINQREGVVFGPKTTMICEFEEEIEVSSNINLLLSNPSLLLRGLYSKCLTTVSFESIATILSR